MLLCRFVSIYESNGIMPSKLTRDGIHLFPKHTIDGLKRLDRILKNIVRKNNDNKINIKKDLYPTSV